MCERAEVARRWACHMIERIDALSPRSPDNLSACVTADGQTVSRWLRPKNAKALRLPALAADLVARRVNAIAAARIAAAREAKAASATIPIVLLNADCWHSSIRSNCTCLLAA